MRKIIQIVAMSYGGNAEYAMRASLTALCDDGTIWDQLYNEKGKQCWVKVDTSEITENDD
jgi:hypothetical protein